MNNAQKSERSCVGGIEIFGPYYSMTGASKELTLLLRSESDWAQSRDVY
jgi:hypothetical protein